MALSTSLWIHGVLRKTLLLPVWSINQTWRTKCLNLLIQVKPHFGVAKAEIIDFCWYTVIIVRTIKCLSIINNTGISRTAFRIIYMVCGCI